MSRTTRLAFLLAIHFLPLAQASAQQADGAWRVATGRVQDPDGKRTQLVFTAETRRDVVKDVTEVLARAEVTRDWAAAGEQLTTWQAACTWSGTTERESLLEYLALRRAELFERFGRTREALAAVEGVLVPADWKSVGGLELKPATAEDLALQARVLATTNVATNRERLRRLVAAPAVADDEIRRIVSDAIQKNDRGQIQQLGKRAVPALIDIAIGDAPEWMSEADDPLAYLMEFDEAAAAKLVLDQFDRGGPFWRRRAMRAMRSQGVLRDAGTWVREGEMQVPRLLDTWWPPVVSRLLREPDVAAESLDLAADLARGDALDAPITAAILQLLRSGDRETVLAVQRMLNAASGRGGTRRILVEMLASPDAEQRAFAAEELADYRDDPALRAQISSPDRAVRIAVVQSLDQRSVHGRRFMLAEGGLLALSRDQRDNDTTPEELALIETALRDSDAEIRFQAISIQAKRKALIAAATWDALAVDADPRVRATAAWSVRVADRAITARVMAVLAHDTDTDVLSTLDNALGDAVRTPDVDAFLPAIRARRANARLPFGSKAGGLGRLCEQLVTTTQGAALVGEWAEEGHDEARMHAFQFLQKRVGASRAQAQGGRRLDRAAMGIPYDDRRLARLFAAPSGGNVPPQTLRELSPVLRVDDVAPWHELALDEQRPLSIRLNAFALALQSSDARLVDDLVRALVSTAASTSAGDTANGLRAVFDQFDAESARRVLAAVLVKSREKPAPALTGEIVTVYVRNRELDPAAADAILAENLAENPAWWSWDGALAALRQVAARPLAAQGDWLERAARRRTFGPTAAQLLGELREPAYRPLLVECIDAGWLTEADERARVQNNAIVAIGRYLDDEAVEVLLDAAVRVDSNDLRTACYQALERIQVHREQRAAWEQRKRAGVTKDAAIAELVRILESADAAQRAQAVRSLATLGAVEELPRVVKLLKDADAGVRAAAASALEVLNASTAKPR